MDEAGPDEGSRRAFLKNAAALAGAGALGAALWPRLGGGGLGSHAPLAGRAQGPHIEGLTAQGPAGGFVTVHRRGARTVARGPEGDVLLESVEATPVLEAAFEAAQGGALFLGPGEYVVEPRIDVSGDDLTGQAGFYALAVLEDDLAVHGTSATRLRLKDGLEANGLLGLVTGPRSTASFSVQDLTWDGNNTGVKASFTPLVYPRGYRAFHLRGVRAMRTNYLLYGDAGDAAPGPATVTGCLLELATSPPYGSGIALHNGPKRCIVSDNVVQGGSLGIFLDSVHDCVVSGNVLLGQRQSAIELFDEVRDCLVTGNLVGALEGAPVGDGIRLAAGEDKLASHHNLVAQNVVRDRSVAIALEVGGARDNAVTGNLFRGNERDVEDEGEGNVVEANLALP